MTRKNVVFLNLEPEDLRNVERCISASLAKALVPAATVSFRPGRSRLSLKRVPSGPLECIVSITFSGDLTLSLTRDPDHHQPLPVRSDRPLLHNRLISDIEARREHGIKKYGQALQAENGRNFLLDFYEEILDAAVYVAGELEEQQKLAEMLEKLLGKFALSDSIYNIRDSVTDLPVGIESTWDHPKVVEFSEMVTYFQNYLKRLQIATNKVGPT